MPERSSYISENIVICIDCSRSMFRKNFEPNRFVCGKNVSEKIIKEKLKIDGNTVFAIVKFSDQVGTVSGFTNNEDELCIALESITLGGEESNFGYTIKVAIELLLAELRKTRIKVPRIIIISDANNTNSYGEFSRLTQLARDLNIRIDTIKFGESIHPNILKIISDFTEGRYYYINDVQSLIKPGLELAKLNIKTYGSNSESKIENPIILRKYAVPLLKVLDKVKYQETWIRAIRGYLDYKKCLLCFSETDTISKASFYLTGRYCPNCNAPFHINCLALWAESQKEKNLKVSRTCRCPRCFYLLKIPNEVIRMLNLKYLSDLSIPRRINSQRPYTAHAELTNISNLDNTAMLRSCPICDYIFEENQKLVQCECGTLYHLECFQKLWNSQCKYCEVKLKL